ncbi:hypothetical protein DIPPA_24839 [Diplonema papillatum]|nr:hypothetical protein DIPPA_24839 [Diplonema papillatum]
MMHFELGVFVSSATIRRGLAASQGGGLFSLPFGPPAPSFAEDGLELCVAGSAPADKAHVPISLTFSDPPGAMRRGADCFGMTGPTDASMYGIRQN